MPYTPHAISYRYFSGPEGSDIVPSEILVRYETYREKTVFFGVPKKWMLFFFYWRELEKYHIFFCSLRSHIQRCTITNIFFARFARSYRETYSIITLIFLLASLACFVVIVYWVYLTCIQPLFSLCLRSVFRGVISYRFSYRYFWLRPVRTIVPFWLTVQDFVGHFTRRTGTKLRGGVCD